jgi:hypothetical protein
VAEPELHRFRKTYADTLADESLPVPTIMVRLGHCSLDVTDYLWCCSVHIGRVLPTSGYDLERCPYWGAFSGRLRFQFVSVPCSGEEIGQGRASGFSARLWYCLYGPYLATVFGGEVCSEYLIEAKVDVERLLRHEDWRVRSSPS